MAQDRSSTGSGAPLPRELDFESGLG